ncbi:hypothetical protein COT07_01365 [Candidatus Woesearchaeota archaeon CG07_land_8_20_14_0_80_44_23]|nr:MAG: hypothetical protein COT07_01365 [Candidatus Woesearchaeota archaeon CG07_land_8_20_14_0_80_44_23]
MNKKILGVFLILLAAAILVLPRVRADGNSSETNETGHDLNETEHENETELNETEEEEIRPMRFPHGAQVRLLELEKSITRNILVGNQTIAAIKAGNSSANTTNLVSIIDKLIVLRNEVRTITVNETAMLNKTSEELAQQFVDIKREAINLSKEFRDAARPLLKETDRQIIREYMKEIDRTELKNIDDEIRDARHRYNADLLNATFSHLGLNNSALLERVRNGDAKVGEIKNYVRDALRNETPKQRQQAMLKLREAEAKRNVYQEAVRARVLANQSERLNQREQHMNQVMQNLSQRHEQLSERIDEISAQIEEHRNRRQD